MVFNIDFDKLILWLLPTFLRKAKMYAYLQCLCRPVVMLYADFTKNREANLYKMAHNGQVFSLQKVLNDRFDNIQRRIYIGDGLTKERIYIYTTPETKPIFLQTIYLYNSADYGDSGVDFIVWIPLSVTMGNQAIIEAKALIDFYKRASKRYKIYIS
ncbi:MAG: hypothetical protein EAY81_10525 [Bacteroidetes bacterium]|nr:MAG: hypothetical protein EAY81_10525 [Bacteroidota bacterium]